MKHTIMCFKRLRHIVPGESEALVGDAVLKSAFEE
jgi:hypothetical protein